jgi:hypothetical protein
MRHHQRVSAEIIEEMTVDGNTVDAQYTSKHFGEGAFDAGRRGAASILNERRHRTVS